LFIHQLSIVGEEADETVYWLELIHDSGLVEPRQIATLVGEADQLMRIMSASLKTARNRR
jgi:four helix bundle protein